MNLIVCISLPPIGAWGPECVGQMRGVSFRLKGILRGVLFCVDILIFVSNLKSYFNELDCLYFSPPYRGMGSTVCRANARCFIPS